MRAAAEMVDSLWYRQVGERSRRLVKMMRTGSGRDDRNTGRPLVRREPYYRHRHAVHVRGTRAAEAAAYDRLWPAAAPHIATRLHLVDAVRDGDRSEDLLEMVGA